MGNAVHQMLIDLTAEAFMAFGCGLRFCAGVVINRCLVGENAADEFFRLFDAVGHLHADELFAVKARHVHTFVGGNDDTVRIRDFFRGQHIFSAAGAVGFRL